MHQDNEDQKSPPPRQQESLNNIVQSDSIKPDTVTNSRISRPLVYAGVATAGAGIGYTIARWYVKAIEASAKFPFESELIAEYEQCIHLGGAGSGALIATVGTMGIMYAAEKLKRKHH